jgi:hypothetical protein
VAGACALVEQACPAWSPSQIKDFLESEATDLGTPGKDNTYGSGLVYLSELPGNENGNSPSLISPQDKKSISFGNTNGQVVFSFSTVANAEAYLLNLTLKDMLNHDNIPLQVLLTDGTPGFSISGLGVATYSVPLDTATWDALAFYDISWSISVLSDSSDTSSIIGTSDMWSLKLQPSQSVTLTSPTDKATLNKATDSAPQFTWELYQGAASYYLILAHVSALGFDAVLEYPGRTLNLLQMDNSTWQTMPTGTWYWTVIAMDGMGDWLIPNFTIFSFEVQ